MRDTPFDHTHNHRPGSRGRSCLSLALWATVLLDGYMGYDGFGLSGCERWIDRRGCSSQRSATHAGRMVARRNR